jgi:hypothetical protein
MRRTAMSLQLRHLMCGAAIAMTTLAAGVVTSRAETPPATPAAAAPAACTTPAPPVAAATLPGGNAVEPGMRAFIEPETGKLGPPSVTSTAVPGEESAPPAAAPILVHMPDGSDMLDLQGTMQDYTVIQLDASGRVETRCVQDPNAAARPLPPAPQREDR